MAVFETWKKQLVCVVSMSLLCLSYCGSPKPGGQCLWLDEINSWCDMCNFVCEGKTLNCSNKKLKDVAFSLSDQTIGLDASHNKLGQSPVIRGCSKLEWIDLSYNRELKVVKRETFENMKCESLKIVNMNHCGILLVVPKRIENMLPNLMIFLIANNSFQTFNAPAFQKLENFKVLDVRGNPITQEVSFYSELTKQNVIVLEDGPCNVSCAQIDNFCQTYDLTYQLPFCQGNAGGFSHQITLFCVESKAVIATLGYTSDISSTSISVSTSFLKYIVPITCTVFVALVLLITYKIRKCWKRRGRQNQYNRWLAVYTPPESVCTYRKRVSFSGEIVLKERGENITKKKLNSDEFKKCRQFDISLLIRTQSLPPQLREEGDERPIRVVSWI